MKFIIQVFVNGLGIPGIYYILLYIMTTSKKHKTHTGGRAIEPSVEPGVVVINCPRGDTIFTKDIWEARGTPSDLALGDGWTGINDFTFVDSYLQKIKIPSSVISIGNSAFENTPELVSVTFNPGSQLKTIGENAFRDAKALTTIEIPSGVERMLFATFANASSLTSIIFQPNSRLKIIDMNAFNNTDLRTIDIPKSVQDIRANAFYDNANLTTIRTYPVVLESLNADYLNLHVHFGENRFDEENDFFGIYHPVNIISMVAIQGGRRKSRSRTRKSSVRRRRRRDKNKSRRRRTNKRRFL
jgi:hypothetical protein